MSESDVSAFPFTVNDVDPKRTFVHVLDELTLDILFSEFDTAYDFIRYLSAKEKAIRAGQIASVTGEEDLIAYYMQNGGLINDSPFSIPDPELAKTYAAISIVEGFWLEYSESEERRLMKEANSQSYFWDALIENFAKHIRAGTIAVAKHKDASSHETALRQLAAEGRLSRRSLAQGFLEKMRSTPHNHRSSRVCFPPFSKDACFILVLYPRDVEEPYELYREERIKMLEAYGLVCKFKFPQVKNITLIGMEPKGSDGRSEDILAMEVEQLSDEEKTLAKSLMEDGNILNDVHYTSQQDYIAPLHPKPNRSPVRRTQQKTGRNDPCNCGSGKKFKHCCYS